MYNIEASIRARMADTAVLQSYLCGEWHPGDNEGLQRYFQSKGAPAEGQGSPLTNPTTGNIVAWANSAGVDIAAGLAFARETGGPALRALTFAGRAALLGGIADALSARRDDWYEISRLNSGNTRADAAIDVDGAIGTLKYYAKVGAGLGEKGLLTDGAPQRLARDPTFQGRHIGVPISGVAVHINAYNFPSWGLWGKAAVALLAGVPVLAKPATSTAWLAEAMVRSVVEAGVLPVGAISLLTGSPGALLDHLEFGDAIAFTGSAETGASIRSHAGVASRGVRINIEADSLNSALLGPDAANGPVFDLFVSEVVKEMTAKAGQKCTAIRRVFVPKADVPKVVEAITGRLAAMSVGDPSDPDVHMGPLVSLSQRRSVEDGIRRLSIGATVHTPDRPALRGANWDAGAFVAPTLLEISGDVSGSLVHDLEVFGPVATLVPYSSAEEAFSLARRGGGSLAASVFSDSPAFLAQAATALGESHGRLLLIDPSIGQSHTGHGIVLPSLLHGGPGRAGGGAELGGLRGLWFYHQRTAIQASSSVMDALDAELVDPAQV